VVSKDHDIPMESPQTGQPFYRRIPARDGRENRVTIPSRWRRGDLDEFFAIPNSERGFLMVMPPSEFRRLAEKVEKG